MIDFASVGRRLNALLYQRTIKRLTPEEIELARQWTLQVIRREHPELTDEQVARYYDRLLRVRLVPTDFST